MKEDPRVVPSMRDGVADTGDSVARTLNHPDAGPSGSGGAATPPMNDAGRLSLGPALRALREARGVSLGEASARIKFSTTQLSRLESEQWVGLPSGVPLRGLVRSYARYLDADVQVMLQLLDDAVGPTRPEPTVSLNGGRQPLSAVDMEQKDGLAHRTWVWLLIIVVLLGVVAWYAVNRGWVPDEWLIFDWLKALRP